MDGIKLQSQRSSDMTLAFLSFAHKVIVLEENYFVEYQILRVHMNIFLIFLDESDYDENLSILVDKACQMNIGCKHLHEVLNQWDWDGKCSSK